MGKRCDWCSSSNLRLSSVHSDAGGPCIAMICDPCTSALIAKPKARLLPIAMCRPAVAVYAKSH